MLVATIKTPPKKHMKGELNARNQVWSVYSLEMRHINEIYNKIFLNQSIQTCKKGR